MQIDAEDLRRYYASLPDEALLALDRTELSEMAQKCYDEELERRELVSHQTTPQDPQDDAAETGGESESPLMKNPIGWKKPPLARAGSVCSADMIQPPSQRMLLLSYSAPEFHAIPP